MGLFAHGAGCVHASDVQVVVAGRVDIDDRAFEAGDRGLQQRQTGRARDPGRATHLTSIVSESRGGAAGETVGEGLLILTQDVDGVAAGRAESGRDMAATVERNEDEGRAQRDGTERVDGGSPGSVAVPGGDYGHTGSEAA